MAATFFNWLIGRGGEKVISTISDVVDGFHHSGEEKSAEKLEVQKESNRVEIEKEREITKRWESDQSRPITSLTRPFLVIYLTIIVTVFGALDASIPGFTMSKEWIELFTWAWITTLGGYFTLRTVDKRNVEKFKK
jgi:hypothetical protein